MNDINQIIEIFSIGMNKNLFNKYILFFLNFV